MSVASTSVLLLLTQTRRTYGEQLDTAISTQRTKTNHVETPNESLTGHSSCLSLASFVPTRKPEEHNKC